MSDTSTQPTLATNSSTRDPYSLGSAEVLAAMQADTSLFYEACQRRRSDAHEHRCAREGLELAIDLGPFVRGILKERQAAAKETLATNPAAATPLRFVAKASGPGTFTLVLESPRAGGLVTAPTPAADNKALLPGERLTPVAPPAPAPETLAYKTAIAFIDGKTVVIKAPFDSKSDVAAVASSIGYGHYAAIPAGVSVEIDGKVVVAACEA